MRISSPYLPRILAVATIGLLVLLALHWRPSRQVTLHQEHLLQAAGDRNWKKVKDMLSPDYRDRWGQTRETALGHAPEAFADFLVCDIQGTETTLAWKDGAGVVTSRIKIAGSGGPIAQYVIQQCEALKEPFAFQWQHRSWKPWDWALVEIAQPEIELPEAPGF